MFRFRPRRQNRRCRRCAQIRTVPPGASRARAKRATRLRANWSCPRHSRPSTQQAARRSKDRAPHKNGNRQASAAEPGPRPKLARIKAARLLCKTFRFQLKPAPVAFSPPFAADPQPSFVSADLRDMVYAECATIRTGANRFWLVGSTRYAAAKATSRSKRSIEKVLVDSLNMQLFLKSAPGVVGDHEFRQQLAVDKD